MQGAPLLFELLVPMFVSYRLPIRTKTLRRPSRRSSRVTGKGYMSMAKQYRAKAAEFAELSKAARLPAETREFRKREQSYRTLAENEEWMADNLEKINCPGADDNWYGDAILAQQGTHKLGCHGAGDTQSTAIPTEMQQLFDDAGSKGGLLQTATLRGRIARFLNKHKTEDFR